MKFLKTKTAVVASLLCASSVASAAITVGNVSFRDSVIQNPTTQPFYIDYRLFGSSPVAPNGFVDFYLTRDGGQTGYYLGGDVAEVNCSGLYCVPSPGNKDMKVTSITMSYEAKQALNNACLPTSYDVIALYNGSSSLSLGSATLGTRKPADWVFTSGTLSPATTTTDGVVTIDYTVSTTCPSTVRPGVGVYLADANFNVLGLLGTVLIGSVNGSSHTIQINFGAYGLPTGDYNVVLFADSTNMDAESNENNNYGSFAVTLTNPVRSQASESNKGPSVSYIDPTPEYDVELQVTPADATRAPMGGLKELSDLDKTALESKAVRILK